MVEKRYYKRNEKITISGKDGDILIPSLDGEILVIKDVLYIKEITDAVLEEKEVHGMQRIQNGDSLRFAGFLLTFSSTISL